jgi:hypothetical protein
VEEDSAYYFKCDTDKIYLIKVDKTEAAAEQFSTSKEYNKTRELELFEMLQSGCTISEGEKYEKLTLI